MQISNVKKPTCSKRFGGRTVWGGWQVLKGCEVRLLRSVGAIMTSFGLWIGVFPSSDNIGLDWLILAIWFRGVPGLVRQDVDFCLRHLFQKNLQGQVLGVRHVQWRSEKLRFLECEWLKAGGSHFQSCRLITVMRARLKVPAKNSPALLFLSRGNSADCCCFSFFFFSPVEEEQSRHW